LLPGRVPDDVEADKPRLPYTTAWCVCHAVAVLLDLFACHASIKPQPARRSKTRCVDGRCREDRQSEELQSRMLEVSCDPCWPTRMKLLGFPIGDPAHTTVCNVLANRSIDNMEEPMLYTRAVALDRIPSNRRSAALGGNLAPGYTASKASWTLRIVEDPRHGAQGNDRQTGTWKPIPRLYATRRSGASIGSIVPSSRCGPSLLGRPLSSSVLGAPSPPITRATLRRPDVTPAVASDFDNGATPFRILETKNGIRTKLPSCSCEGRFPLPKPGAGAN
jgi:hypothetical protein